MATTRDISGNAPFPNDTQRAKDTKTALAKATAAAPSYTEGDHSPLSQDLSGALRTNASLTLDAQFTDDAAFTPGTSKGLVVMGQADDTGPDSVNEGDAGALRMSTRRELYTQLRDAAGNERGANVDSSNRLQVNPSTSILGPGAPTIDSYTSVAINLAAAADQSIVAAPGASKQIWVYGYQLTVNAAGTVAFQDEDNVAHTGIMPLSTGIAVHPSGNFSMPLFKVATNKALELDIVTSEVDGTVQYAIVSV